MRRRRLVAIAAGIVAIGLAATVASLVVVTEIRPTEDGYVGEARLFGFPFPYTYAVLSGGTEMENQVSCEASGGAWACDYPASSGRVGIFPLAVDWLLWCLVATLLVAGGAASIRPGWPGSGDGG